MNMDLIATNSGGYAKFAASSGDAKLALSQLESLLFMPEFKAIFLWWFVYNR